MMVDVTTEAAMAEIERKRNLLMKLVKERDHEIVGLRDQMKACETSKSSQTPTVKANDKEKVVQQKNQAQQSIFVIYLLVQQRQDMITSSIRAQYGGTPQASFMFQAIYQENR